MAAFPDPMYVLLKGQVYLTVVGANVQTPTDQIIYDTEVYRRLMPAGYIGRAWQGTAMVFPPVTPALPEAKDDNFTGTAPTPMPKTRTRITWTKTNGDFCGECWADQYIGYSSAVPKFVSS